MKIVPFDERNWKMDHPTGNIAFQHMLKGDPSSPDNFMFVLSLQLADFHMPRHRHNFDQIRLPIRGAMNIGKGLTLGEGQVGYFVEGLPYGPQDDLHDKAQEGRLGITLQFGGGSNYGFMSIEQRRQAMAELSRIGRFEGPIYHRPDGTKEWGLNAIWEHVFGVKLKYPRPRYREIIIADPKCFNWTRLAGSKGVEHKYLGAFSERGVWVEMIRLAAGASWSSVDPRAKRLMLVLSGEGTAAGEAFRMWTALQADPGENLTLSATVASELYLIGLPPIEPPSVESEEYDMDENAVV